ncbi:MAG: formate dehydrogenase accessory sulfurtransferase FdhD [Acetobacterales bacterium]
MTQALIRRVADGGHTEESDQVAVEAPVAFVYNCRNHAVMMATPVDLEDFAWGFSIAEGVVRKAEEVLSVRTGPKGPGYALSIEIPAERAAEVAERARNLEGRTGCGLCGIADIDRVLRPLPACRETEPVSMAALMEALHRLPSAQVLNRGSGALHAAAFASPEGRLLFVREDVGRHNALDKLIGAAARDGVDPESGFIVVTSRCSMEMVQKVATFGCPILIAISAPTSLAIELAERSNLTVAAFARETRLNLYTHPERII